MSDAEVEALRKELADLKRGVVETARRYAVEHDLCSVVDEALKEVPGLLESEEVTLEIKVPFTLKVEIDPTRMDKPGDAEEIAKALAPFITLEVPDKDEVLDAVPFVGHPTISPEAYRDSGVIGIKFNQIEVNGTVVDLATQSRANNPRNPWNAPRGYTARLGGYEGRVMHYFRDDPNSYLQSLCYDAAGYLHSLPTSGSYFQNKVCVRCTRKAEAMR